jgi:hypothetical protein
VIDVKDHFGGRLATVLAPERVTLEDLKAGLFADGFTFCHIKPPFGWAPWELPMADEHARKSDAATPSAHAKDDFSWFTLVGDRVATPTP